MKPTDEDTINLEVMKLVIKGGLISLALLLFCLSFRGTTIYNQIIVCSLIYFFNNQLIRTNLAREEFKLLKQFEHYLGDVRHYYYVGGMVEEAVYDSLEFADYEISLHMNRIYDILINDKKEDVEQYNEIAPNKFLVTFLALCQVTLIYGDSIRGEQSLFLTNLNHLKNEVSIEILKKEKVKHAFSGLTFITILPVFFLKAIENWSISNLPDLEKYYSGSYGIIVSVIIFLFTLLSYHLVNRLKEDARVIRKEHVFLERVYRINRVKQVINHWIYQNGTKAYQLDKLLKRLSEGISLQQFMVQKFFLFFSSIIVTFLILINVVAVSKWNVIHYTKDFGGISLVSDIEENSQYREILEKVAAKYKKIDKAKRLEVIERELQEKYKITSEKVRNILKEEILLRIQKYQGYHFKWYYILISLFIACLVCNIPLLLLYINRIFMGRAMEDEVMQFQCIIIMLMYIEKMNVETILEWMENFGEIFRSSIMECVDHYSYDNERALNILKEKEPFLPFVRIIENLEACDKVGVEKAFDEIANQRSFFVDKRKQDNEINISNKSVIARIAAYVPLGLTVGLYLIIPFVLESIAQLMGYISQIQGM